MLQHTTDSGIDAAVWRVMWSGRVFVWPGGFHPSPTPLPPVSSPPSGTEHEHGTVIRVCSPLLLLAGSGQFYGGTLALKPLWMLVMHCGLASHGDF